MIGAVAGSLGAVHAVWGQNASASVAADDDTLQEVIVTAERREENLQKTAVSIAAVSGQEIAQQGENDLADILKNTPGVLIEGTARGATPTIRGLGFDLPPQVGESAVSTNFDGIYDFRSESATFGYYDLARVEVLRGPQGTLYGRNATGGVVNVISNEPTPGQFGAAGTLEIGNYDLERIEGSLNVPVSDDWTIRGAGVAINRNGYLSDGQNDAVGQSARLRALYKPSEDLSILTTIEYSKVGGHGPGISDLAQYEAGNKLVSDDFPYASNFYLSMRYFSQLDAKIGPGVLTFIPSYEGAYGYNWSAGVTAGTPNMVISKTNDPTDAIQRSAELRYSSDPASSVKWVGGLYYYDMFNEGDALGPPPVPQSIATTRSDAIFGQITYPLTPFLRLVAGVRETFDKKTFEQSNIAPSSDSDSHTAFDWKVGAETDLNASSLLYLTVSTGHRPGGFNTLADTSATLVTPGEFYKPESLISYEIGSKNRFLDDRLQLNGSIFNYSYKDYQLAIGYAGLNPFSPAFEFVNADARIYGGELESQVLFTKDDRLDLGVNYLHSRLTQSISYAAAGVTQTPFYDGEDLSHSPNWSIDAGLQHRFDFGDRGSLTARADYRYTGGQYVNAVNNANDFQPAYATGDASLNYAAASGKWSVSGYCKNVNNDVVKTFLSESFLVVSAPRTYGVVISAHM